MLCYRDSAAVALMVEDNCKEIVTVLACAGYFICENVMLKVEYASYSLSVRILHRKPWIQRSMKIADT